MSYPGTEFDLQWRRLVWPEGYRNPSPQPRYHLVVIGAGPAGLVTAIAAAGLGAKVALVERTAMGGDCLNVGCVPSKSLLEFTHERRGAEAFDAAFAWLRQVRASIAPHDSVDRYTRAGVDVFLGHARFIDDRSIAVDDLEIAARRFVIATGARAAIPPIPGLAEAKPLTNETVFELRARPASLAIIGAGPIGCELSQAFARLGTEVHLIELAKRVLPTELDDASRIIAAALEREGVILHLGASVTGVERHSHRVTIATEAGAVAATEVLVAAGRTPNTSELNLAAANVDTDEAGLIVVDARLRTRNPRIFAAGDVCSAQQFTHNADAQARVVIQNTLFAPTASTKHLRVPHCTYTRPEVAQVGPHRDELDRQRTPYEVFRLGYEELDRGKTQDDSEGFVEILTKAGGDEILGATIVGRDAGEQLAAVCIAMQRGIGLGQFSKTVLPYPTRSESLRRLADTYNRSRLTPAVKRLMEQWFRWTA
jgi:pyruvate/2-oxoglutarate dehydrogenase complex dihydrolipoamide dehydrogenase (E3) component